MFHLHSSADHAFVITRRAKQGYTFSGSDEAVSWEAVRSVKYLVPTEDGASDATAQKCPVCLDSFTCPRITKCGHCFCLSCLLRHVHTQAEVNKSQAVKCPCCGLPVHVSDVKPVILESVQPPRMQKKMTLVKLHRTKECPAPYLPRRGAFRHSSPHAAPSVSDRDAVYSRFCYVDPDVLMSQLAANQVELESALSELQQQQSQHSSVAMEVIFLQMALESVRLEQQKAMEESVEERALAEQYRQPHAGMYQTFPDRVFPNNVVEQCGQDVSATPRTRPSRAESIDSTDSSSQHGGGKQPRRERNLQTPTAIMYLDQGATHFYQSEDGQLCFLSKFNMSCLVAEFTPSVPETEPNEALTPAQRRRLRPLPDVVEGNVLEKETVHLSPDVRKRMPFLSHLPLYTDIMFVELDLNRLLSAETKEKFKGEMEKRRKKRKNKVTAEKRADRAAKKKEQARISELKARMQRIDPNDEFFQIPEEPTVLVGDEFGPAISGSAVDNDTSNPSVTVAPSEPQMSFSAAAVSSLNRLNVTDDSFPSLSTSPPTGADRTLSPPTWSSAPGWHGRARSKAVEEEVLLDEPAPTTRSKKSKGKKVLLFSTGGHRGAG